MDEIENRSEFRVTGTIVAFASNAENTVEIKCVIRDLSYCGCRIVTSSINELPELIELTPEGFDKPISAMITWRSGKTAGLCFEHAADQSTLELFENLRSQRRSAVKRRRPKMQPRDAEAIGFQVRLQKWLSTNRPKAS